MSASIREEAHALIRASARVFPTEKDLYVFEISFYQQRLKLSIVMLRMVTVIDKIE